MATSSPNRRRQRSVRVTVAVSLLAVATVAVVLALPTQSPAWLSASSVLALVCGSLASRIIYTELLQSRREAAEDRAAQAQVYRTMFSERAEQHAEFTTAMTERLASRDNSIRELESAIVVAEQRAMEAETRVNRESRRANDAMHLVAELQAALDAAKAEEAAKAKQAAEAAEAEQAGQLEEFDAAAAEVPEGAAREGSGWQELERETVANLLAWEDKVNAAGEAIAAASSRKQA